MVFSVFSIKIINNIALVSSTHFVEFTSSTNTGISTVNVNISYMLDEKIKKENKNRKNHLQFDIVFVATLILLFCLMAETSENSTREEKKNSVALLQQGIIHTLNVFPSLFAADDVPIVLHARQVFNVRSQSLCQLIFSFLHTRCSCSDANDSLASLCVH